MKKQTFTLILFLLANLIQAQNPLVKQWDKRFGGSTTDILEAFQQTNDGGYILGGWSRSQLSGDKSQNNRGKYDYWVIKVDSVGIKQWDKRFGGYKDDELTSLQQTSDNGYILGGGSQSGVSGDKTQPNWDTFNNPKTYDYWIVKINKNGHKQWDKRFGGTDEDWLRTVKQTFDGGYILGGVSYSYSSGDKTQSNWGSLDFWVLKTDALGNKLWDKRFGGTDYDDFYSLLQTNDGGFIIGGSSFSDINGDKTEPSWGSADYWIIKIDSLGNKQWDKRYGGTGGDYLYSMQQTNDGGYILGGVSTTGINGDKSGICWGYWDYWIVKIDSLGNKQWDKDFGGTDNERGAYESTSQTSDNGYLISGTSYSNISGDKTENNVGYLQTWIVKMDSLGNKQWDKTIFTSVNYGDGAGLVLQTKDGCYATANFTGAGIGGYKTQPGQGGADYWMVKFCDTTLTTSITQLSDYPNTFSIYPNPAESILTITLNKSKKITIINLLGEIMIEKNISSISNEKIELDISFLPSGIYFIKVDNEVKKFVKE